MAKMCDIAESQNSKRSLDYLAAFSWLYQRAKIISGIQFILTVPAALVAAFVMFIDPGLKVWVTFFSLTVALLDVLVLDRVQTYFRKLAARVQEQFDCGLFKLDWNSIKVGAKPDTEGIVTAARKFKAKNPTLNGLRDWYPPSVEKLPMPLSRLICQRTNCWWDASLRKKYANVLLGIVLHTTLGVLVISLLQKNTVEQMILTVYAPIAPAVLWSSREIRRQREAAESLEKLRSQIDDTWTVALNGKLNEEMLFTLSRQIQDMVFDGRSRNPLVFDWINSLVRPSHQVSINEKAKELVDEGMKAIE